MLMLFFMSFFLQTLCALSVNSIRSYCQDKQHQTIRFRKNNDTRTLYDLVFAAQLFDNVCVCVLCVLGSVSFLKPL